MDKPASKNSLQLSVGDLVQERLDGTFGIVKDIKATNYSYGFNIIFFNGSSQSNLYYSYALAYSSLTKIE